MLIKSYHFCQDTTFLLGTLRVINARAFPIIQSKDKEKIELSFILWIYDSIVVVFVHEFACPIQEINAFTLYSLFSSTRLRLVCLYLPSARDRLRLCALFDLPITFRVRTNLLLGTKKVMKLLVFLEIFYGLELLMLEN